jgi:putative aldouronate transport system substrate-binding protein
MKKYLVFLIVVTMLVSTLTGCKQNRNDTKDNSDQSGDITSAADDGTSDGSQETVDGWAPIGTSDNPEPVKIVIKDVLPDEEDVILMEEAVEEKMAAHGQYIDLQVVEPPSGSYATALPLAVRTGEIDADIIYFQGGDLAISQEGLLEDLTPYIEASTYVNQIIEPASQERIKNYPYLLWLDSVRIAVPMMRKDWAEQLDSYKILVEDPTIDNYYNLFKEMKDKGLVDYAITADGSLARLDSIFNQAFGVTTTIVKEGDKYIFSKATEAEKNKLEFYAKLYKEGLLDPEYITNTWDVAEQKFYEGKAGILSANQPAAVEIYNNNMIAANGEEAELIALPPAKGVAEGYAAVDTTKESRGFAINVDSEHKAAAWAFLEFMASSEGRIIDKLGIEGVHYNIEGDKIVRTEAAANWWSRIWGTTNAFEPNPPLAESFYSQAAQSYIDLAGKYYVQDINIIIPDDMAPSWDSMNMLYNEFSTNYVLGSNTDFDSFVNEWNKDGGDQFSEYIPTVLQ